MFVTYPKKYNQSNSDFPEHLNLYYLWYVSFLDVNLLYVVYLLNKVFKSEPHILIIVFYFNFQAARCCTPYITNFSVPFHWITLMFNHGQLCLLFNFYIYTFVVTFDKVYSYTLSREYRVARYRYSRLLFTSEDRLCANLRVQWQ